MSLRIGCNDNARRQLLADYALLAVSYSVVPEDGQVTCCCGAILPKGHPFHRFRAVPRAEGGATEIFHAGLDCAQHLIALAGPSLVPATFCDPLGLLAVDKHRVLGVDQPPVLLSPLNGEVREVLTLLMKWAPPNPGSDIESMAVQIHQQPANDLCAWDLRSLNTLVNRVAGSLGGDLRHLVQALARRHGLPNWPASAAHFPLIRLALTDAGAFSYI